MTSIIGEENMLSNFNQSKSKPYAFENKNENVYKTA